MEGDCRYDSVEVSRFKLKCWRVNAHKGTHKPRRTQARCCELRLIDEVNGITGGRDRKEAGENGEYKWWKQMLSGSERGCWEEVGKQD